MARVYKCDRCGETYEDYTVTRKINSENARQYNGFIFTSDGYDYEEDPVIDLCPKCLDELIKWLTKGDE